MKNTWQARLWPLKLNAKFRTIATSARQSRHEARRVWGAETPIELFVIQALAKEKLFPACQMLVMDDGATFPSLYHLWSDVEFRHSDGLVTEADLFFPAERVAVFCDGGHHASIPHAGLS